MNLRLDITFADLKETALVFYQRIRGYWGVENKVHYVRDVTFGEDKSRVRTLPLPQILAIASQCAERNRSQLSD